MARAGKDAFIAKPIAVEDPQPETKGRGCNEWGHTMFVDGVEVDPKTMKPISESGEDEA